jgi:hypothetical protein
MTKKWRTECRKGTIMSMDSGRKCIKDTHNPITSIVVSHSGITVEGKDGILGNAHQDRIVDRVWAEVGDDGIRGAPTTLHTSRDKFRMRIKFESAIYKMHKARLKRIVEEERGK